MVSYGVDPSPIILNAKIALLLLFKIRFKIQDCMTLDEVIYLLFLKMIGYESHKYCNLS
jgi:hypothetical protein